LALSAGSLREQLMPETIRVAQVISQNAPLVIRDLKKLAYWECAHPTARVPLSVCR